jgi:hypothetical protein
MAGTAIKQFKATGGRPCHRDAAGQTTQGNRWINGMADSRRKATAAGGAESGTAGHSGALKMGWTLDDGELDAD